MIIPAHTDDKESAVRKDSTPPADAPPSYEDSQQGTSRSLTQLPPLISRFKTTNFVNVYKSNGAIRDKWVIDPYKAIPAPLRASSGPGLPERNLRAKTLNGAVYADVTVVPSVPKTTGHRPMTIEMTTHNGEVRLDLHDDPTNGDCQATRPPVRAILLTYNGAIRVRIPRSFRGMMDVTLGGCGHVKLSEEIKAQVNFSQNDNRRLFIGEFKEDDFDLGTWAGDEIKGETRNGSLNLSYDDEHVEQQESGKCLVM